MQTFWPVIARMAIAGGLAVSLLPDTASAEPVRKDPGRAFPSRPVSFVMPGPAGGGPDQVARILAAALAARWGVAVIVENKPGATGAIGAESVAHGDSSGHRLLFAFTAFVQAPYILAKPPYHVEEDFTPVIQVAYAPAFLAVAADSPSHSLAEFVARAKQSGRPQSYGSFGIGSSYHIYGEALKKSQGLNLLHVPYKGEAAAMTDLLGGQIDATFVSVGTGAPHVKAGKIRPLALVSRARSAVLPDVPTFAEAGVPDVDAVGWFGVLAPSSAPHAVVQQVADDIRVVMREPAIGARLRELGYDPVMQSDPAAFKAFVNAESRKWKSLIADTGIKAE